MIDVKPLISLDTPVNPPPSVWYSDLSQCRVAGCRFAFRRQDDQFHFVHDGLGRYSMVHISDDDLKDASVNIWRDQVLSWIGRLHAEAG